MGDYVRVTVTATNTGGSLSVDRTQVNEITPKRIIINDIKPDGTLTAASYNLPRNQGISSINE